MGLQNAVTSLISRSRVRTTHVSGMATDIGIGLSSVILPGRARDAAVPKLMLHVLTLSAFALGGIGGALLYDFIDTWFFIVAGLFLIVIALPGILSGCQYPSSR